MNMALFPSGAYGTARRMLQWLPLVFIVIAGAGLRFYQVGSLPPGLYRDEAFYGLDALAVLRGHYAVYFTANNGREGLFIYMLAAAIALFGRTPEALRIVSALIGSFTILAIYGAGRTLFSHRIGVLSAGILAVTFWHLAISRVAFRAISLPLLLCLIIWIGAALVKCTHQATNVHTGLRNRKLVSLAIATGLLCGITAYTYTSAVFLYALLIAFGTISLILSSLRMRGYGFPERRMATAVMLVVSVSTLLTLAPYLIWVTRHPELVFARAEQVSILSPAINKGDLLGILWRDVVKAAGMFVYQGDRIWRHNDSQRPVFDGVIGLCFLVGIGASMVRAFTGNVGLRSALLFVVLWLVVFLIPTILAEDTPHYLRAIGALPAACVIAALGMETGLTWLSRRGLLNLPIGRLRRVVGAPALIATVVIVLTGYNVASDYLAHYVRLPLTAYWLEDNNVQLAVTINAYVSSHLPASLWLQDRLATDNPALRFLSPSYEDGLLTIVGDGKPVPVVESNVLLLVDPNHDWTRMRNTLPSGSQISISEGPLAQNDLELQPRRAFIRVLAQPLRPAGTHDDRLSFAVFSPMRFNTAITTSVSADDCRSQVSDGVPTDPTTSCDGQVNLRMIRVESTGSNLTPLLGSQIPLTMPTVTYEPGTRQTYSITLAWSTSSPMTEDLAVFVHWWRNGNIIAQNDSSPAQGYLPMPTWRVGDVIMDMHTLSLDGGMRAGDEVDVGIYRRSDNKRLLITAGSSSVYEQNAARVLVAVEP